MPAATVKQALVDGRKEKRFTVIKSWHATRGRGFRARARHG